MLARIAVCKICSSDKDEHRNEVALMNLEILEEAAEGGYAKVFRCLETGTGEIVALKMIPINGSSYGVPSVIIREVSFLKELQHDNIVRLLRVTVNENRYVNLVFEHLQCDLHDYIRRKRFRTLLTVKSFMFQILSALDFCHSRKILHRDLKPSNVLVDQSNMMIKLADFGLAREFRDDVLYTEKLGTSWYRAPEILCDNYKYSAPVDVWSAGCIFAEMLIGRPLFQTVRCQDELDAIFRLLGTPTEETWPGITQILPGIHKYPNYNPVGMRNLVPDIEPKGLELLLRMLCINPIQRISAAAALKHDYFNDDRAWGGKITELSSKCLPCT